MDHADVQAWILDNPSKQVVVPEPIQQHLAGCAECQKFASRWAAVRQAFATRPVAVPAAGFAERWMARLELARRRRHQRQVVYALLTSGLGAGAALVTMMAWLVNSPAAVASLILGQIAAIDVETHVIIDSLRIVAASLPPLANVGLAWLLTTLMLGLIMVYTGFSALWTASFYRSVLQTRTKEN
jgi:hypothetical protein